MGDKSKISWTDSTWNPTVGCTRVSAGCDNCYAVGESVRLAGHPNPKVSERYTGLVGGKGRKHFLGIVRTVPDMLDRPLRWTKPRRIFVNSMSDLFHPAVPDEFIARVFTVMAQPIERTGPGPWRRHTFQILTKRPERAASFLHRLRWRWGTRDGGPWRMRDTGDRMITPIAVLDRWGDPEPAPNIWIGTSVEDQSAADERIPHLLRTPAAVRFLSCEPLLGPVDLTRHLATVACHNGGCVWKGQPEELDLTGDEESETLCCPSCGAVTMLAGTRASDLDERIHQVIVGGESGHRARPMDLEWARSLRDQCQAAGVAFHMKQVGSVLAKELGYTSRAGKEPSEWPEDLRIRQEPGS